MVNVAPNVHLPQVLAGPLPHYPAAPPSHFSTASSSQFSTASRHIPTAPSYTEAYGFGLIV